MRPRRLLVHVGFPDLSLILSLLHQFQDIAPTSDLLLRKSSTRNELRFPTVRYTRCRTRGNDKSEMRQILPAKRSVLSLHNVELGLTIAIRQQIAQLLVINLEIRACDSERLIIWTFQGLKNRTRRTRNDPMLCLVGEISLHRMSLSGTCLPIRKDGTFIASHDVLNDWLESRIKDFLLRRKRGKDIVKAKGGTRLTRSCSFDDSDGFVVGRRRYHW